MSVLKGRRFSLVLHGEKSIVNTVASECETRRQSLSVSDRLITFLNSCPLSINASDSSGRLFTRNRLPHCLQSTIGTIFDVQLSMQKVDQIPRSGASNEASLFESTGSRDRHTCRAVDRLKGDKNRIVKVFRNVRIDLWPRPFPEVLSREHARDLT